MSCARPNMTKQISAFDPFAQQEQLQFCYGNHSDQVFMDGNYLVVQSSASTMSNAEPSSYKITFIDLQYLNTYFKILFCYIF